MPRMVLKDGLIADPTRCHFDPQVIACTGADTSECLTPPQMETVKRILSPSRNPRTGEEIFPGLEPGSELGWATLAGPQPFRSRSRITSSTWCSRIPNWDWKTLNFDSDVRAGGQSRQRNHQRHRREFEAVLRHGRESYCCITDGRIKTSRHNRPSITTSGSWTRGGES